MHGHMNVNSPLVCTQREGKRRSQIWKGQGPPEPRGRPGQTNNFVPLQTDILNTLSAYDSARESFWERVAKLQMIFQETITPLKNSLLTPFNGGFGGLEVSVLASGTRIRRLKSGRSRRIFRAFLRRESKAVGPVS